MLLFSFFLGACGPIASWEKRVPDVSKQDKRETSPSEVDSNQDTAKAGANCSRENDLDCIDFEWKVIFEWVSGPEVVGESILRFRPVRIEQDQEVLLDQYDMAVSIWMPDHGHGSSPVIVRSVGDVYIAEKIYFIMAGRWEVRISLQSKATREILDTVRFGISL